MINCTSKSLIKLFIRGQVLLSLFPLIWGDSTSWFLRFTFLCPKVIDGNCGYKNNTQSCSYGCLFLIHSGVNSSAFSEKAALSSLMKAAPQITIKHVTLLFIIYVVFINVWCYLVTSSFIACYCLPSPLEYKLLVVKKFSFLYIFVNPMASMMPGIL